MRKVFHINSNYLTSKLHENLIDELQEKGIDNTIYMPRKKEKEHEFLYKSNNNVYSPVAFNNRDKYLFLYKQAKIIRTMEKKYDFNNIDISHAHTLFTDGNIANYLFKKYNIPYIVAVRGMTDIDGFFKKRINLRRRGREILKNASAIIFMSEANKEEVLKKYIKDNVNEYKKKSFILPNGIDDFWFENENYAKKIDSNEHIKFIYVGKINKTKNILKVVEALQVLKKDYNVFPELTVVGKVIDQEILKRLQKVKNFKVTILQPVPKEKLIDLYRKNDIFIMPSYTETFGLVYPEAMSQGLPVIYTKDQGFDKHFLDGEVGFAINPTNENDIAEKIIKIIKNYDMISTNCIEKYKKFNWNQISNQYIKLYSKVLKKN